jgi:hypothetical protein
LIRIISERTVIHIVANSITVSVKTRRSRGFFAYIPFAIAITIRLVGIRYCGTIIISITNTVTIKITPWAATGITGIPGSVTICIRLVGVCNCRNSQSITIIKIVAGAIPISIKVTKHKSTAARVTSIPHVITEAGQIVVSLIRIGNERAVVFIIANSIAVTVKARNVRVACITYSVIVTVSLIRIEIIRAIVLILTESICIFVNANTKAGITHITCAIAVRIGLIRVES